MPTEPSAGKVAFTPSQIAKHSVIDATRSPGTAMKPHVPGGPGEALRQIQGVLAEELVTRQYLGYPELAGHYGSEGREECLQDAQYHLAYLADAMNARAPELYANYVAWAKVLLGKRGMSAEGLAHHLELTRKVVKDTVKGEAGALAVEYIDSGLARMPAMPAEIPTYLRATEPHAELAREYIDALMNGERHVASQKILHAIDKGVAIKDIYLHVFQPAQYEVGRLWQLNELTVAQEHYCTAATQLIMSQLYPHILTSPKGAHTLVSTCVAGDLHEIGLRMVTDFFEMDGWNTFYLGANMPAQAVIETLAQRKAHMLCISTATSSHLGSIGELIQKVRADAACRGVKILVGGSPFQVAPELWRTMNSDGCAADAQAAIRLANQLMTKGPPHGSA